MKNKIDQFVEGFTDLQWHWMNWTDLINQTCGGEAFINPIYKVDLEFNRNFFFNELSPYYQKVNKYE
ncbi:MAG: hypothetical protein R3321_02495 [Nitrososphaeraceae archaeon]|nr:hypothetical protein [Nitrososphaeraceae archaeon]